MKQILSRSEYDHILRKRLEFAEKCLHSEFYMRRHFELQIYHPSDTARRSDASILESGFSSQSNQSVKTSYLRKPNVRGEVQSLC